jgi:putative glutamine amidotransferase
MRADAAGRDGAPRDAIDAGWAAVLARAIPEVAWTPVPNLGAAVIDFVDAFALDGILLAGGEDLGASPSRDATERRLLGLALERGLPVLGVCRGLEVVQDFFGGPLCAAGDAHHAGRLHRVAPCAGTAASPVGDEPFSVPSYHRFGVAADELSRGLAAWALSDDGLVEGLRHRSAPIVAVMWHPERPMPLPGLAERLLREFADGFSG